MNIISKIVDFIVFIGLVIHFALSGLEFCVYSVINRINDDIIDFSFGSGVIDLLDSKKQKMQISSDTHTFDINAVNLEVKYGTFYIGDKEKYNSDYYNNMLFVLYAHNQTDGLKIITEDTLSDPNVHFIFHIPKEGYNEGYGYDLTKNLTSSRIEYKCKTNILLPKELFCDKSGEIYISFDSYSYDGPKTGYFPATTYRRAYREMIRFTYKMLDENTVKLGF